MNKYNKYLESDNWEFVPYSKMEDGGMTIKKIGGKGTPTVEVEGKEHIQLPNGFSQEIQGKSHANGGIPLNLPEGSKILSENLKITTENGKKKSYANLAKKFETKKDLDRMSNKKGDDIQKKTSELIIAFKNQKLDELFNVQEQNKLNGVHGIDVQLETLENQQPMAKYGMELLKAQDGIITVPNKPKLTQDIKNKATKADLETIRKEGLNFIDQEGNKYYYGKDGQIKKNPPGKGSVDFNKAFAEAKKNKQPIFTFNGKKYTTKVYNPTTAKGDMYAYIENEVKPLVQPKTSDTKQLPQIEYRDRVETQYLQPDIDADLNIPAYLPNNYGRLPLNFYDLNPEFIDPRYLDIQPQLNQVSRGQRAFQNNLGSRTASDMSNLLQSQVNAYNQNQNIYGQKYNYDRQQDAAAQQFNAQAVMNTDQYNQSAWFNQLEDPIRRREGALSTQQLKDDIAFQENASNATAFYNNLDYIQNEIPYYNKLNKDQIVEALDLYIEQQDPYKTTKKTTTKKTEDGTERTETVKYGGKVKIKPKLKKK